MMATNLAVSLPAGECDPLRQAVAQLFTVFQRLYPNRWDKQFNDPAARPAWLAALRHAGVTAEQVRHGLAKASALKWPPSSGEFIELCRPSLPDIRQAVTEALAWAHRGPVTWSHPVIGAAAKRIGSFRLVRLTEEQMVQRMSVAMADLHSHYLAGEELDVPPSMALPKPERHGIPPGQASAVADAERAKLARLLGVSL